MDQDHAGEHADEPNVPERIDWLVRELGIVTPEHMSKSLREIYMRAHNAHCMTCARPLGSTTTLVVSELGVLMVFCGGPCLQDMQVSGWLQEQYDDLKESIEMRSRVDADSAPIGEEDE